MYFRWLSKDEDDGQIERELTAGGAQMLSSKYRPFNHCVHNKQVNMLHYAPYHVTSWKATYVGYMHV